MMRRFATARSRSSCRSARWSSTATICRCMSTCCCRWSSHAASRKQIGALVAPPFTYGYKSHQKSGGGNHLPGTTSLDGATLVSALRDVIKEFARHGVRKYLPDQRPFREFLVHRRGHRPGAARTALGRHRRHEDRRAVLLGFRRRRRRSTRLYPDGFTGWELEHGGVLETSLMLALIRTSSISTGPSIIRRPAFHPMKSTRPIPEWTPASGTLSSPKQASAEKGRYPARRLHRRHSCGAEHGVPVAATSRPHDRPTNSGVFAMAPEGMHDDTSDMQHVMKWHNGEKEWSPFSDQEMTRRQNDLRRHMEGNRIDAALLTSYHNICYYSGFLYCYFGRKYGMVIDAENATTITAAHRWRPAVAPQPSATTSPTPIGSATTTSAPCSSCQGREAHRHRVRSCQSRLSAPARGCASRRRVRRHRPAHDVAADDQVGRGERADQGGRARSATSAVRACDAAVKAGVPEYEVALAATQAMVRDIARTSRTPN